MKIRAAVVGGEAGTPISLTTMPSWVKLKTAVAYGEISVFRVAVVYPTTNSPPSPMLDAVAAPPAGRARSTWMGWESGAPGSKPGRHAVNTARDISFRTCMTASMEVKIAHNPLPLSSYRCDPIQCSWCTRNIKGL